MTNIIQRPNHELSILKTLRAKSNPVAMLLLSYGSNKSRIVVLSLLKQVVRLITGAEDGEPVDAFNFPWGKLDRFEFQNILNSLQERGFAYSTIKNYRAALRGVMNEAYDLDLIDSDQLKRVLKVKPPSGSDVKKGRVLSMKEAQDLFDSCPDTVRGVRDRAILSLLFGSGLRRSELVSLTIARYHRAQGVLKVAGKGNKERKSFLTENSIRYLNEWIDDVRGTESGALFVQIYRDDSTAPSMFLDKETNEMRPNFLSSQAVYYILEQKQLKLGMERFSPHDLRRTLATRLLDVGENIVTVRDTLGHSSISTTQEYIMKDENNMKKAVRNSGF